MRQAADLFNLIAKLFYGLLACCFLYASFMEFRNGRKQQQATTDKRSIQPWYRQRDILWGILCLAITLGLVDSLLFTTVADTEVYIQSILLLLLTAIALLLLIVSGLLLFASSFQNWHTHKTSL